MIFIMMALGLNIVVGYAGLLDLGYVAFYAMGAYTVAWFASQHFSNVNVHVGGVGVGAEHARLSHLDLARGDHRRGLRDDRRDPDRLPDPAPTRRLPRDRDARLRRDHAPDREQRRQPLRAQHHERPAGDQPDRPARLRQHAAQRRRAAHGLPELDELDAALLLDRALPGRGHGLLLGPAARLAPRASVDRDPRGRDGRRRDGRPADADEDVGVRGRRVLRRRRRGLLRELQGRHLPRATSTSTSPSSSSAWSSSAGWATSGA